VADIVRIELVSGMRWDQQDNALVPCETAEIRLADLMTRKISRAHKPSARVVGTTRAGVLRQLADWIETHDDPTLSQLWAEYQQAHRA
jgi:hypothetical protein